MEVIEHAERDTEKALVAELFERGVFGLEATLLALQEGRLMTLLYAAGFAAPGHECPRCHALDADAGPNCGYCGERLVGVEDIVERAITRAGDTGARVEQVRGEAGARLAPQGGIGALLRF
jgi:peptide subunit release factor 1 (eRF1)